MRKTTKAEFDEFCSRVRLYAQMLGLGAWTMEFRLGRIPAKSQVRVDCEGWHAAFELDNQVEDESDWDIRELALHETLHLWLEDFCELPRAVEERKVRELVNLTLTAALTHTPTS